MKRSERREVKQELRDATQELLGSVIVGFRKKADLSQEDLAYESGVDRSFMSKVETGQTAVSLLTLMRLAKTLGVKTSEFIIELENRMAEVTHAKNDVKPVEKSKPSKVTEAKNSTTVKKSVKSKK